MKILMTGATGYIGSRLTVLASHQGHDVICASRRRPRDEETPWFHFDLSSDLAPVLPVYTDVVIHLAANTSAAGPTDEQTEVSAARRLIQAAQREQMKFIFVSSQAAHARAPTPYGRTKWHIEQEVLAAGGFVARPGQVYGGELRGLHGTLVSLVGRLPLLPAFLPSPRVQPIHVDDLAESLLRIADRDDLKSGVYCLAAPEPVSFSKFLSEIAKSRLRCKRLFVPFPSLVVGICARVVGTNLQRSLGLNRLQSLLSLPVMETAPDLEMIGVKLRPLSAGLHPSGDDRRRKLLQEGNALLTYLLKRQPDLGLLRRYARAVESLRDGRAIGLPSMFLSVPSTLSLLDEASRRTETAEEFIWRLDAATLLCEASPGGGVRFLGTTQSMPRSFSIIATAMLGEIFWRLTGVVISPFVRSRLFGPKRV